MTTAGETAAQPRLGDPGPRPVDRIRTGVVWVHGIGTQQPGDSLFPWTQPILDVFAEWRRQYDRAHPDAPIGENPVDSASVIDPDNRWILVDVPRVEDESHGIHQRAQWLFTEAYWAADVRPPSFGASAAYLRRNLGPVIQGITDGYGVRNRIRASRLEELRRELDDVAPDDPGRVELEMAFQKRWAFTDRLDALWGTPVIRWSLGLVGTVVATIALVIYAALHAIPITAVKKRVEIAAADTFIVEWFADLAVILDDQAQSAAIRSRVLDRVRWLTAQGCADVVLLAHSGGTLVSYGALLRYGDDELDVAKLVTFGEAIRLGWKLEDDTGDWFPGNPIRGNLRDRHPKLRWVDIWASYDPAPSGPIPDDRPGCAIESVSALTTDPNPNPPSIQVESRPVTNFMLLSTDHGGYWSNDEGFLVPVIRHIDDAAGTGNDSRFFRSKLDRTLRIERRRRRVALLLAWRWLAFLAALAAILGLLFGAPDATATGDQVAAVWSFVPGHEIVSGTIDGIGNIVAILLGAIGLATVADWLGSIGPAILGALVPIVAVVAIFVLGDNSWYAHDALERRRIRGERLRPWGSRSARSEATLVVGGLIAIVLASWFATPLPVAICGVVAVSLSLIVRRRGPRLDRTDGDPAAVAAVAAMTRLR